MSCSRDLNLLVPEFRDKYLEMKEKIKDDYGLVVVPYCTLRDPLQQAREWRSTRSSAVVKRKVSELRKKDCNFLADCVEFVGPQSSNGRKSHVTYAIPGLSWHQWGEAVDSFWEVRPGVAAWSSTKKYGYDHNAYRVMEAVAESMGMRGLGSEFGDWPHIQLSQKGSPTKDGKTLRDVDSEMENYFGHLLG